MKIGLDIGSTTLKCIVTDENGEILHRSYERHYSRIVEKTLETLQSLTPLLGGVQNTQLAVSGSAGLGIAEGCGLPFVQEVYATRVAVKTRLPQSDVVIELGGEDAKILFLTGSSEVRMNGTCAGGTGAFIDQMAALLNVTAGEMDQLAEQYQQVYTIASRCGVFAKSDIQPLLNQGARSSDIARSIFIAVVNQTVAGLAQGRAIEGNIVYLGGPLTFLPQLRDCFDRILHTTGTCPEDSLYYVALGAAQCADSPVDLPLVISRLGDYSGRADFAFARPLFENQQEYDDFSLRHNSCCVDRGSLAACDTPVYLGIDAGSTTVKTALIDKNGVLLDSSYLPNSGNPVPIIREYLQGLYAKKPDIKIASCAMTGYGEEIIKAAFSIDHGVVETVAHFMAAQHFLPQVEFIIDIGGQDIKCFKVRNGAVDSIFLNEACSSGCGSFLQTFANALGYSIADFATLGLFAKRPMDLGSRCTVFMNSSVKQAQKDGASVGDISAGLSMSVVKNALYKVIRASSPEELGKRIVVQGGTFHSDVVLRAFEREVGVQVVRPDISGLMGAFGAALYARSRGNQHSGILTPGQLDSFTHDIKVTACGLCNNNCKLTVNTFDSGRRFIGGNRCDRPITKRSRDDRLNLYASTLALLERYGNVEGSRETIGLPLGLSNFELLPFWHTFFTRLGFGVAVSPLSTRKLYLRGQQTIPSDTVCFPAKLMHGHVQWLLDNGVKNIFYPCMSYNLDESMGDNHYNCPVVAYYPEVIGANMRGTAHITYIKDYVGLHRRRDFPVKMYTILARYFTGLSQGAVKSAATAAYEEYALHLSRIRAEGERIIAAARQEQKPIIVLAGRPYHTDPEINHGIAELITSFDAAVISEIAVSGHPTRFPTNVLNQWTYHSRLYAAARYVGSQPDMDLVQLVSFGCGVDAITTDEVRDILEDVGKIYTQIKIDEISNLGAIKIRLRSLFAVAGQPKGGNG